MGDKRSILLPVLIGTWIGIFLPCLSANEIQDPLIQETSLEWSLIEKIDESEDDLKNIKLSIEKKRYTHYEERIVYNSDGNINSIRRIPRTDNGRELALKLLNLDTGMTEIVKVVKRGRQLTVPPGYDINVVKRVNGIEWNGRNTHFKVTAPKSRIVLKIAWPTEAVRFIEKKLPRKKGKKRPIIKEKYVENIIYTPYSTDDPNTSDEIEQGIHTPDISIAGAEDIADLFKKACQVLRDRGVRSRAFPQYIVCELPFLPFKAYPRLLITEQMDESEFNLDQLKTAERVFVILRANRGRAFAVCNSLKPWRACGLMQFTDRSRGKKRPGTYSTVVRSFPEAGLINSFPEGAFNHVNAIMAEILLHDLNLRLLVAEFGQKILDDPVLLELALAGCYNGGCGWTVKALGDYYSGVVKDWTVSRHLRSETRGYFVKDKYLIDNDLP